jgi:catechol 2,3-dioxygenase-like lactoylglutathione lyase family enzyme
VSLRRSPLLYVFFETYQLTRQRELLESVIGLPVVEVEPHQPHHRHGVVKYDAGNLIISLNLSTASRFRKDGSDALATVFTVDQAWPLAERLRNETSLVAAHGGGLFTDLHGHHHIFRSGPAGRIGHLAWPAVDELQLTVGDLAASVSFYRDVLGLELLERAESRACFATGRVRLALEHGQVAVDGGRLRRNTYLLVFHTSDINRMCATLIQRGLTFKNRRVGFSEIGGTIRFEDPSGHRFCLYEPSAESLSWGSGGKVMEIVAGRVMAS